MKVNKIPLGSYFVVKFTINFMFSLTLVLPFASLELEFFLFREKISGCVS